MWMFGSVSGIGVGGLNYVDRGNPSAYDFDQTTLTADGAWHTLSLSAIVPVGAKAVVLRVGASRSVAGTYLRIACVGNSAAFNCANVATQVANVINEQTTMILLNASRQIQYWATSGVFVSLRLVVMGWWI